MLTRQHRLMVCVMWTVVISGCTTEPEYTPDMADIADTPDMPDMPDMLTSRDMETQDLSMMPDMAEVFCATDEFVQSNVCETCAAGTGNEAGDEASGEDTVCEVVLCAVDEFVRNHRCEGCPSGTQNMGGDDASRLDTSCDGIRCPSHTFVQGNVCVTCPAGTTNDAGDDASAEDTICDVTFCGVHEFVQDNQCSACPAGTANEAGDDASAQDTACAAILCAIDEFVQSNQCVVCPDGTSNEPGDEASDPDTSCEDACSGIFGVTCAQIRSHYIKASHTDPDDYFGYSVSLHGDILAIGATGESSNATGMNGDQADNSISGSGAVYVFERNPVTQMWSQQAYLKASNTGQYDEFGASVSLHGDMLAIGAPGEDSNATEINGNQDNNSALSSGAVYVFERDPVTRTWVQHAYIKASNAERIDNFGRDVSLFNNTLAVGATGEDSNAIGINGNQADNSMSGSGAVYVFEREPVTQTWTQQAYLKASNAEVLDFFGVAVSLYGDTLAVAAPGEDSNATGVNGDQADNSMSGSGAVYVFERNPVAQTWVQQAYLKATNTDPDDYFGYSISLHEDTLAIGATGERSNNAVQIDNSALSSGAVYVFEREPVTQTWTQQAYLKASNPDPEDYFGYSVVLHGDTLAIGAKGEGSNATGINGDQADNSMSGSGAVYVFERNPVAQTWVQQAYLKATNTGEQDSFGSSVGLFKETLAIGAYLERSNATGINGNQSDRSEFGSGAVYIYRP